MGFTEETTVTDWTVRRASLHDAAALRDCLAAAYAEAAGRLPDLPSMTDGVEEDIARLEVWVAERRCEVIGVLVLAPADQLMHLANVAVRPEARGLGLGRHFLELTESEARRRGLRHLRLATHAGMAETVALYRRTGWEETERNGNKIMMAKHVAS